MFSRLKDPVEAIVQVVAVSPGGRKREVTLSLQAPGMAPQTVQATERFTADRVPRPGMVLAGRVDRDDPGRFEVDWDQVPSSSGVLDDEPAPGPPPPPTPPPAARGTRLERVERLAALRDRGALTPEEFEAEKRRILAEG